MADSWQPDRSDWRAERLRYRVLRAAYQRAGGECTHSVAARDLVSDLGAAPEQVNEAVGALLEHGFLFHVGEGPRVCITPKGIRYIERAAGRRASIRVPALR